MDVMRLVRVARGRWGLGVRCLQAGSGTQVSRTGASSEASRVLAGCQAEHALSRSGAARLSVPPQGMGKLCRLIWDKKQLLIPRQMFCFRARCGLAA